MPPAEPPIFSVTAADLSLGEVKSRQFDYAPLDVRVIRSPDDALFEAAYARLWDEFGAVGEMETRAVIERRLAWDPAAAVNGNHLKYDLILVRDRAGEFVAVRDHTAIVPVDGPPEAIVHLSHVLVAPPWRGGGVAGWLRAWPIATARACLAAAGAPAGAPVTLVAEMEHPRANQLPTMIRLKAYEKAGFVKVDPRAVRYLQPDFRPPAQIDADSGGAKPLPMGLVVRRVGRDGERAVTGREVRAMVTSLYGMYGTGSRAEDMRRVYESLRDYPPDEVSVALVPPTNGEV